MFACYTDLVQNTPSQQTNIGPMSPQQTCHWTLISKYMYTCKVNISYILPKERLYRHNVLSDRNKSRHALA